MAKIAEIASKIASLAETSGKSIKIHNHIPSSLRTALRNEGLTVTSGNLLTLTSFDVGIILVRDSSIINKSIKERRLTTDTKFVYLIIIEEDMPENDMEENFELVRKGKFDFGGEIMHFSVWKLVKVWVNI